MWIGANNGCSYPNYLDVRDNHIFAGLAGYLATTLNLRSGEQIEKASAQIVTGNLFQMLGVNAALGLLRLTRELDLAIEVERAQELVFDALTNGRDDAGIRRLGDALGIAIRHE